MAHNKTDVAVCFETDFTFISTLVSFLKEIFPSSDEY